MVFLCGLQIPEDQGLLLKNLERTAVGASHVTPNQHNPRAITATGCQTVPATSSAAFLVPEAGKQSGSCRAGQLSSLSHLESKFTFWWKRLLDPTQKNQQEIEQERKKGGKRLDCFKKVCNYWRLDVINVKLYPWYCQQAYMFRTVIGKHWGSPRQKSLKTLYSKPSLVSESL